MKSYLAEKIGKRLGISRLGIPKEVYFEALVKQVKENVVIFEDDDGAEIAIPLDKILVAGPPEQEDAEGHKKPGFI